MAKQIDLKTKKSLYPLHIVIIFILMFGFRFLPAPAPITPYGMAVIGIFAGLIYGWTVSASNLVWPALLAMAALATTSYGGGAAVMAAAFGNYTVVMTITVGFTMGPIAASGIGDYLMAKIVNWKVIAGKPWLITGVILLGIYGLGIIGINQMLLVLLMFAILPGTLAAAGYTKTDRYPNMLMVGIVLANLFSCVAYPFFGWALMPLGATYAATGILVDYAKYMIVMIPMGILMIMGFVLFMRLMRCDAQKITALDMSVVEKRFPNGLNRYNKWLLGCIVVMMLFSIVVTFASGESGIRAFLGKFSVYGWLLLWPAVMMFIKIDGKPLIDMHDAAKTFPWDLTFVMAGALLVAGQLTAETTGVSTFIAQLLGPIFAGMGEYLFLVTLGLICFALTNFLNNIAVAVTMESVVAALYLQGILTDISTATIVVCFFALMGYYTPAASAYGAMLHSNQFTDTKVLYTTGIATFIYMSVVMAFIFIPFSMWIF